MTFPEPDEAYQHGSTVLPGVPLPASAHPHPPGTPPGPAPADPPPGTAPLVEDAQPEPAAARTPWWKKEVGAKRSAADEVPGSAGADGLPVAPPSSAPRVDLAPPIGSMEATGGADLPAVDPPAGSAVPAPPAPRGRHAAPAPAAAPVRGGTRLLVLALIGLLVVLVAVAALVWPGFLTSSDDGADSVSPTTSASATALAVSLSTPDTIEGMRRFTGAADTALDASVAQVPVPGLTDPVSAVYGTGTTPQVQVIAWKAVSPPAMDTVTAGFTGFEGSTGAKVTALREVTAPGLGGHMECGLATVEKTETLQCFWADDASFGAVTVLSAADRDKATSTAAAVRVAVEQTS